MRHHWLRTLILVSAVCCYAANGCVNAAKLRETAVSGVRSTVADVGALFGEGFIDKLFGTVE